MLYGGRTVQYCPVVRLCACHASKRRRLNCLWVQYHTSKEGGTVQSTVHVVLTGEIGQARNAEVRK
jgi:hypothetical protein